ncbi:MAG: GNAT family N-acetyltransferase [Candidatus Latescibacteria bacterium]|nr:GNAT family N-acetyltransferase [Candidatus Latescibacterota bacterium]
MAIETDRLILRNFQPSDLDRLALIMGNAEVMRFSTDGPWSRQRTQTFLHNCLADYTQQHWGYGRLAVVHKADNKLIGFAGLAPFDEVDGSPEVEIGYRLHPQYWGLGLGTEAAAASRDYGLVQLGMKRLISLIEPENAASIRVAEKIGMKFEKEIRKWDLQILVYAIAVPAREKPLGDK